MESTGKLAESLRKIIKDNAKSASEFAEEIGMPKTTIHDILKSGNTTVHTLLHIAEKTNRSPNELLGYDDGSRAIRGLLDYVEAYSRLPRAKQEKASCVVNELLKLFQNDK